MDISSWKGLEPSRILFASVNIFFVKRISWIAGITQIDQFISYHIEAASLIEIEAFRIDIFCWLHLSHSDRCFHSLKKIICFSLSVEASCLSQPFCLWYLTLGRLTLGHSFIIVNSSLQVINRFTISIPSIITYFHEVVTNIFLV